MSLEPKYVDGSALGRKSYGPLWGDVGGALGLAFCELSWSFNLVLESMSYSVLLLMFILCSPHSPPHLFPLKLARAGFCDFQSNDSTNKGHLRSETGGAVRGKCQKRALWAHFEGAFEWPQRFQRPLKARWVEEPGSGEKAFPCNILS